MCKLYRYFCVLSLIEKLDFFPSWITGQTTYQISSPSKYSTTVEGPLRTISLFHAKYALSCHRTFSNAYYSSSSCCRSGCNDDSCKCREHKWQRLVCFSTVNTMHLESLQRRLSLTNIRLVDSCIAIMKRALQKCTDEDWDCKCTAIANMAK